MLKRADIHCSNLSLFKHTMCPRSSGPFYVVTYYIKWYTTSWTYSMSNMNFTIKSKGNRKQFSYNRRLLVKSYEVNSTYYLIIENLLCLKFGYMWTLLLSTPNPHASVKGFKCTLNSFFVSNDTRSIQNLLIIGNMQEKKPSKPIFSIFLN